MERPDRKKMPVHGGIARKLSLWILLLSFLMAVLGSCFHLYREYRRGVADVRESIANAHKSMEGMLRQSLWITNTELVEVALKGIMSFRYIEHVELRKTDGSRVAFGQARSSRTIIHGHDIVYPYRGKTVTLGHIRVIASLDQVYGPLVDRFLWEALTFTLWSVVLGVAIAILFYRQVGRHLQRMSEYAGSLCIDTLDRPLALSGVSGDRSPNNEIAVLSFAINDMREKLRSSLGIMQRQEAQLQWELDLSRAIADICERLATPDIDIQPIAAMVLKHAMALSGSRGGFISVVDPETLDHVWIQHTGMPAAEPDRADRRRSFPVGADGDYAGLWGHALNTGEAFYTNHPQDYPKGGAPPPGHCRPRNFLAAPACFGGRAAGLIALADTPGEYGSRDCRMAERLAEIYALALQRDRYEAASEALQKKLVQAHKMESIGNLAGGIAHDFNNILSAIIGFTELAMDDTRKGSMARENLDEVYTAGMRAKKLVGQILTFARQSEERRTPIRIAPIAEEALTFLRASIPTSIDIRQTIESDAVILGNSSEMHQVFMNLCVNAAQAMEETGGTLTVAVKSISVARGPAGHHPLAPGRYVKIAVSDTGPGIPADIVDSVFDPYFTTKGPGEGSGMGLAVVHGIVNSYGGAIFAGSEPGAGATFTVLLPRSERPAQAEHDEPALLPTGTERILLVDDEAPIAKMGRRALERLGYAVTARTDSQAALDLFRSAPTDYDLVITDMTMPQMSGDVLVAEMRAIRPDIPVILCTGHSQRISDASIGELGIQALAYKPIVKADLARTVREVLDGEKVSELKGLRLQVDRL